MADGPALQELLAALVDGDEDVVQYLVDGLLADPDEANDILEPFVEEHADAAAAGLICTQIVALLSRGAGGGQLEPEPEPREMTAGWELEADAGDEEAAAAAARTDRLQALAGRRMRAAGRRTDSLPQCGSAAAPQPRVPLRYLVGKPGR